jgi:hypothetical protein
VAAGEADAVQRRHARSMADRSMLQWDHMFDGSIGLSAWRERLEPDLDNLREAFATARRLDELDAALAIAPILIRAMYFSPNEGRMKLGDIVEALCEKEPRGLPQLRALLVAQLPFANTRSARRRSMVDKIVPLARRLLEEDGDSRWLYWGLVVCAQVDASEGKLDLARASLKEASALVDVTWTAHFLFTVDRTSAELAIAKGMRDSAATLKAMREGTQLTRSAGGNANIVSNMLIDGLISVGDLDGALREGKAALASLEGSRFEFDLALARLNVTAVHVLRGDIAAARTLAQSSWPSAVRFEMQAWYGDYLALIAALDGEFENAAQIVGYADAVYERHQDRRQTNEADAIERARGLVLKALGESTMRGLEAEGARLRDEDIASIAFAFEL